MKVMLLLHLALAATLAGASGHAAVSAAQVASGRTDKRRLYRTYCAIIAVLYPATLLLGALLYPSFGLHVRAPYLDAQLPWATGLFEIKEHVAALALPLVAAQFAVSRKHAVPKPHALRVVLAFTLFAVVLLSGIVGALLVSHRSV